MLILSIYWKQYSCIWNIHWNWLGKIPWKFSRCVLFTLNSLLAKSWFNSWSHVEPYPEPQHSLLRPSLSTEMFSLKFTLKHLIVGDHKEICLWQKLSRGASRKYRIVKREAHVQYQLELSMWNDLPFITCTVAEFQWPKINSLQC